MNKFIIASITVFMLSVFTAFSQRTYSIKSKKAIDNYEQAIKYYQYGSVDDGLFYVDLALEYEAEFIEAYLLKADMYNYIGNNNKEVDCYMKAKSIDSTFFPYLDYNLGLAQLTVGSYNEALLNLNRFILDTKVRQESIEKAEKLILKCEYAISQIENPVDFNPQSLGSGVNNNDSQYWPSLSLDGKTLIYTTMFLDSTRYNAYGEFTHGEDFFISHKIMNVWSKGVRMEKPLNTSENEGAQQLSADGKVMVFTGCQRNDGYGRCDIYFAYLTNNGWSKPVNAGPAINTSYSEKQPSLSPDNSTLYFSSNRPEGIGGMDLWYSQLDERGMWQKPKNMGELINTTMDDISPYIHADNKTLYFSSEGHLGMGKQDIFISRRDSNRHWGTPQNIGYPINTYEDEFGLVIDNEGNTAYYASDKNSTSTNIYSFTLPEKVRPSMVCSVQGKIYNKATGDPLIAEFYLIDTESNDTVMQSKSNAEGEYLVCLPAGKKYGFNVSLINYLFYSEHFDLELKENSETYILDIGLNAIEIGEKVVLHNIFFETDSYILKQESMSEIEKIRQFVIENPNIEFEIGGFTDNTSTVAYNIDLSKKRAKSVYDALKLPENLMKNIAYKGYGQDQAIGDNETKEGKALNRRTELKIIGKTNLD